MTTVQALRYTPDGPVVLDLDIEGRQLVDAQEADRGEPEFCLIREPLNAHTHIGDAFLTGVLPDASLHELVAPPDGFKHRMLASADPETVVASMATALTEYGTAGARRILDFREEGLKGIGLLRMAKERAAYAPETTVLGRLFEDDSLQDVLGMADGLGVAAPDDPQAEALIEAAHRAGKPVALHASEDRRDDMLQILAWEPDLLIHLSSAERADVHAVAEAGVPVAVCPVSNRRFGLRPPIPELVDAGATWAFGTDNAMFGSRSVIEEAAVAYRAFPDVGDAELVRALEAQDFEQRLSILSSTRHRYVLLGLDPARRIQWWEPIKRLTEGPNSPGSLARKVP